MKVSMDIESRSKINLKTHGVYAYAEDKSTEIFCIAVKIDDKPTQLWVNFNFMYLVKSLNQIISYKQLKSIIEKADEIHAHTAQFERIMWEYIMAGKNEFPEIPLEKWRCTAAKAASYALPRPLDMAAQALGLAENKDQEGYRIRMKMCKPRTPTKHNKSLWHENPEEFVKLCDYCKQDVEVEYAIDKALSDITGNELDIWRVDQVINNRGVKIDLKGVENLLAKVAKKEKELFIDIKGITNGCVTSVRQIAKTLAWLKIKGLFLPDLTIDTVEKALSQDIPEPCRRLLEIRQSLGKSSVSKLKTMKKWACKDRRVRGSMMYHGATTGRWAGRGMQPHNYPRESFNHKDITIMLNSRNSLIELLYGCVIQSASKCLRGMLTVEDNNQLFCADYSSIEGRVLAWIAGEDYITENYRLGKDPYIVFASQLYNVPYEKVTKQMRFEGKTGELACGYKGWSNSIRTFAPELSEKRAEQIVTIWRKNRRATVRFWDGINTAAIKTVETKNAYSYRRIKFGMRHGFLHCRLPSGRLLAYYKPHIINARTPYGQKKDMIAFQGMDSKTNQWTEQRTHGGKLTENIVQAISRDILAEALLKLEKEGFDVVLHIHDEILVELPKTGPILTKQYFDKFIDILSIPPEWAEGLTIAADGWIGLRYRKG